MTLYTNRDELRRYLGLSATQTGDDDLLWRLLGAASRLIDGYAGRRFYPQVATRAYRCPAAGVLLLDDDLLALDTLTNGDGSTIPAAAYHLHPAGAQVKSSVILDRTQATFTHDGDPVDAVTVAGTWGFHPAWDTAWADSGDSVQDDPLAADATALTVSDADAAGDDGWARFATGHLLRIGDEYLHVLAVDSTTDTLTVARGVNGTTAASHAQGAAIAVYQPPADVRQACLRVAAWLYRQKDAGFVAVTGGLRGQVTVPAALPDDVQQVFAPYVRVRVM